MNAVVILESIADLIVKVLLLIIFLPKTLYKIIKDPLWVPRYIRDESRAKGSFKDYVSPIFLYILTGLAPYALVPVEVLTDLTQSGTGNITKMIQDPNVLIRAATFFCIPLLFAFCTELFRANKFSRKSIEHYLLIQCYYFAPLVLVVQIRWIFEYKSYSLFGYDMQQFIIPLLLITGFWLAAVLFQFLYRELNRNIKKILTVMLLSSVLIFAATDSIGLKIAENLGFSGESLEKADALILLLATMALYIAALVKMFMQWRNRNTDTAETKKKEEQ